jgi:hypothetical protein
MLADAGLGKINVSAIQRPAKLSMHRTHEVL